MFNENLKNVRKSKGFTQAELAVKVNVVRQTVSKWEKGLSVPDADTLQKIAEVLEIEVSQLLGAEFPKEESKNEIAEQLARINEQMAMKNRRSSRIWKTVGIVFLVIVVINSLLVIIGFGAFSSNKSSKTEEIQVEEQIESIE